MADRPNDPPFWKSSRSWPWGRGSSTGSTVTRGKTQLKYFGFRNVFLWFHVQTCSPRRRLVLSNRNIFSRPVLQSSAWFYQFLINWGSYWAVVVLKGEHTFGVSLLCTPELNSSHREKIVERLGIGTFSMATEYTKTSPNQLKQAFPLLLTKT